MTRQPVEPHVPSRAMVPRRLQPDEVRHGAARQDQPAGAFREPEQLRREPSHQVQLDLGRGRGELPPADVRVETGGDQIRDRARDRARARDVRHEPRMPRQLGSFEDHLVQVREERVVGHGLVRHVERDRVVDLLGRPSARHRQLRETLEVLLPHVDRAVRERTRALGIPVEVGDRRRTIGRHGFTAPSRNHSAFIARRKMSSPNASTMAPTWLSCSPIARSFSSRRSGGSSKSIESLVARGDRRRARTEDVERVVDRHELVGPLLRVRRVVHLRAGLPDLGERPRGPLAHRHVRDVAGHPVGAEREDGVGPDVRHDVADLLVAGLGQSGVHVDVPLAEPVMFGDAEDLEAAHQLGFADLPHGRRGPALLVHRAALPAGGGHADDAASVADRLRHQAGRQVRLVVGVCPDTQQRSEVVHPISLSSPRRDGMVGHQGEATSRSSMIARTRMRSSGGGASPVHLAAIITLR